jgi:rod shape-determining protein MreC
MLFLQVGTAQGLTRHQAVLWQEQLVGTLQEVAPHSARVQLTTDPNSRIPVTCVLSGIQGIARGDGHGHLELLFTQNMKSVRLSELVLTSGLGGRYPARYVVGRVTHVSHTQVQITPGFSVKNLSYVSVLKQGVDPEPVED